MLEEQDEDPNSTTVSQNTTCAKREPDVRVVAQPVASGSSTASTQLHRQHAMLHSKLQRESAESYT